jgi:hypothetical protein
MYGTLRFLGVACATAAIGCVWLGLAGYPGFLPVAPGLVFVTIVLLALARIRRITRIEALLTADEDQIKTNLGDFEKLGHVEGEATCVGCRKTAPKAGLYYHRALDVYYHPECLARDRRV